MLKNFFLTALRSLLKNGIYSLLNILGLAIGIASFIFIGLFIKHEVSYDNYHSNIDRLFRVTVSGQMISSDMNMAVTPAPMGAALLEDYPEIENVTRITHSGDWLCRYGDKKFNEREIYFADSTFFDIFSVKLLQGNPETALQKPHSIVLTESTAKRYFGNEDPLGKAIRVETDTVYYTVTGVMQDIPLNTHFEMDMLASLNSLRRSRSEVWLSHNFYTYFRLSPGVNPADFEEKIQQMITTYVGPQLQEALGASLEDFIGQGNSIEYHIQPVRDIHLHSDLQYEIQNNGNHIYVYIFGVVAIFIILMACINFTNLATARAANRAKEVGVRKVLGGNKRSLVVQFLLEAVGMSFLALLIGVLIAESFMPQFRNLIGLPLDISYANIFGTFGLLLLVTVVVGLIAGSYPAFFLASFQPAQVLKGKVRTGTKSGILRSILVVAQFVISIAILLGSYVVFHQLSYIQSKDPGFDKKDILVIRRSDALEQQMEAFKQEVAKLPQVKAVTNCNTYPSRNFSNNAFFLEGGTNTYLIYQAWTSFDVNEVLGYELKAGRFHSREHPSDSNAIVINEAAVKSLGFKEPIGSRIMHPWGDELRPLEVIGVVKDFHFKSIHYPVEPAAYTLMPGNWEGYIMVKLKSSQSNAIEPIQTLWQSFTTEYPFEYYFFEEDYNRQYQEEVRTSKVMGVFSFLSVLIAAMGLLGLISFLANERQKEVGIRKSYGASATQIALLFGWHIIRLVLIAWVLAAPLAYFWARDWLADFAFRIQMPYAIFVWIPLLVMVFSVLIVSWQTIKAAHQNPARILRYE